MTALSPPQMQLLDVNRAADAIIEAFPDRVVERRFRWQDYLAATRGCKVYDFDAGTWQPYPKG